MIPLGTRPLLTVAWMMAVHFYFGQGSIVVFFASILLASGFDDYSSYVKLARDHESPECVCVYVCAVKVIHTKLIKIINVSGKRTSAPP